MLLERHLTEQIVGGFFTTHKSLGFGQSEKVCANGLCVELQYLGLRVAREVHTQVVHRGVVVGTCKFDMVVEDRVLIEIKASKELDDADTRQILTYLHASPYEVGLLLNFGPSAEYRRFIYTNDRKGTPIASVKSV
jgi:GxxExxY protein